MHIATCETQDHLNSFNFVQPIKSWLFPVLQNTCVKLKTWASDSVKPTPFVIRPLYCLLSLNQTREHAGYTPVVTRIDSLSSFFFPRLVLVGVLGHRVEGRTVLEPLDLGLVEGMRQGNLERLAVLGVNDHGEGLANGKLGAEKINLEKRLVMGYGFCCRVKTYLVIRANLVVVGGFGEGQRQHTLLLQVGLVNTSERSSDDGQTTKMTGLESSVLSGRTLTVVPVTNDSPTDTLGLVVTSDGGNGIPLTSGEVSDLVGLVVGLVDGTDQHVVGDVVEMATVLQPWTSHRDVISGGLALGLDEDREVLGVLAVPGIERGEKLETIGSRGDINGDGSTVLGGGLVGVLAWVVASGGETVTGRGGKLEVLAVFTLEGIGERVEVEIASDCHGDDDIGGGNKGMSSRVAIVSAGEVTVVGRDDRVGSSLGNILAVPLTNAGATGVGENNATKLLEGLELTVTLDGSANLLGTRSDSEARLGLDTVVEGITGNGSTTSHILVRGVGARADQANLELLGPLVVLDSLTKLGDGSSQIGSEGSVDVGLELRQVNLDELVVLGALIGLETVGVGASKVTNLLALSGLEVLVHVLAEGEDGGGGTDLSTAIQC